MAAIPAALTEWIYRWRIVYVILSLVGDPVRPPVR